MITARLFVAQRLSALILAPLVLAHLVLMIIAIQGGLSAEEILGRTQGSPIWFVFYGLFVLAVSVHGAIGVRGVVFEWLGLQGRRLEAVMWGIGLILLTLGWRAVWAVTFA